MMIIKCKTQKELDAALKKTGAKIWLIGNGYFETYDSSQVTAYNSSQVRAYDSSQVTAYGSSQVTACDSSQVTATKWVAVTIIKKFGTPKVKGGTKIVIPLLNTPQKWCDFYGVKVSKGIATVYKAVRDNYFSQHGADYSNGLKPKCHQWDKTTECGNGLHFSPHPFMGKEFNDQATRYVACGIALKDMVIFPQGSYPNKCKAPEVVKGCYEVDQDGNKLKAKGN